MSANYRMIHDLPNPDVEVSNHFKWLKSFDHNEPGKISEQPGPEGYEKYHVVDVLGDEFIWMNETFTKDKFTWYVWYESVFLVPDEMIPFLRLRWS